MENENKVLWFNKNDWRDMVVAAAKPEGFTQAQPLEGIPYQQYDEAAEKWIADPDCEKLIRMDACKTELAEIDSEAGAGRAVRGAVLAAALKAGVSNDDVKILQEIENRANELRKRITL